MDTSVVEQLINEILPYFEDLDTQSAAVLQFLKDTKVATDSTLATYLEQAAKASNIRWQAARLRMISILSSATKEHEEPESKLTDQPAQNDGSSQEQKRRQASQNEKEAAEDENVKEEEAASQKQSAQEAATIGESKQKENENDREESGNKSQSAPSQEQNPAQSRENEKAA